MTDLSKKLCTLRKAACFDMPSMALAMGLSYHTYRSYEYGRRAIPTPVIEKAEQVVEANRKFLSDYLNRLNADLDRQYPNGILSEPDPEYY